MILAIDFDNVLHDPNDRVEGKKMGKPVEGAVEAMQALYVAGNKLIIHTVWATNLTRIQALREWLAYFGIMYHEITNQKPTADYYLDDKALKFESWPQALAVLSPVEASQSASGPR